MSAPNAGRQSPDPERAPGAVEKPADAKIDAAPSDTHAKEESENAKENILESNPTGPLEEQAHAKTSKGPGN